MHQVKRIPYGIADYRRMKLHLPVYYGWELVYQGELSEV